MQPQKENQQSEGESRQTHMEKHTHRQRALDTYSTEHVAPKVNFHFEGPPREYKEFIQPWVQKME